MNKSVPQLPEDYVGLLAEVKKHVRDARYAALKSVNKELVGLYWDIGRMIVERQQIQGWGKSVVEQLAKDLQSEFPGVQGYSAQNLWYMRQFFLEYHEDTKLQPLVGEISWTKNLVIMARCKEPLEREFYIRMTRKFGWTKNVLIHQIDNQSYQKYLLGQTNFDQTVPPELSTQAHLAVRDEYTFDFLELGEEHSAHRRGHLPHQPAVAKRTGRPVTLAARNRPTAGHRRMRNPGGLDARTAFQARRYESGAPETRCFCGAASTAGSRARSRIYDLARALRDTNMTLIGGFQSPMEKEFLDLLLRGSARVVLCPARSIKNMRIRREWRPPISEGRLLILSPFGRSQHRPTAALAAQRNDFVAALATELFIPYAAPGGKTESLSRQHAAAGKAILTLDNPATANLLAIGARAVEARHRAHRQADDPRRHRAGTGP